MLWTGGGHTPRGPVLKGLRSMAMCRSVAYAVLAALLVGLSGCGDEPAEPGAGPFGAPSKSPLLAPFAGEWVLDLGKTLDAQKAGGATDEDVERLRKLHAENPQLPKLHPDMTIMGNVAVCSGTPSAEYRFFAMHQHGEKVCGKAWHHEDRFDPGDMSKCYVRLAIADNRLYLEVRMKEALSELSDPDLQPSPPTEHGSAAACDADSPPGDDWSEWTTYVFARKE